jgi:DNA repair protein RecO (recombination protein O)
MALLETEAVILRNVKLGEADKIVVALTKQEGVVRGVARGARKLKSKYGASLEPFTVVRLTFYEKETRELVSISEAEILKSYFNLSGDDAVFTTLERVAGLVLEFAPLRAPDERFFRMFSACLEALEREPGRAQEIALYSEVWVLRLSGFLPEMTRCASCQADLEREQKGAWLGHGSSLSCTRCSGGQGMHLTRDALALLTSALRNSPSSWVAKWNPYQTEAPAASLVRQVLYALTARALEREPRFRAKAGGEPALN